MKKVINNSVYDTNSAKLIFNWDNGYYPNDFHYLEETLYRNPNRNYFLFGEGNAASIYQERCGSNSWCGGKKIIPMSIDEAKAWAQEHMDGDEYIAEFGNPEEGDTIQITVSLSTEAEQKLKDLCAKGNANPSTLIEKFLISQPA